MNVFQYCPAEPDTCLRRIKDEQGLDVRAGEAGELVVGGPLVAKGYYQNETATKEAFRNGRFFTGDVGLVKNGYVYIVDRKKVTHRHYMPLIHQHFWCKIDTLL